MVCYVSNFLCGSFPSFFFCLLLLFHSSFSFPLLLPLSLCCIIFSSSLRQSPSIFRLFLIFSFTSLFCLHYLFDALPRCRSLPCSFFSAIFSSFLSPSLCCSFIFPNSPTFLYLSPCLPLFFLSIFFYCTITT